MTPDETLAALTATLRDLATWLNANSLRHVVIGGVAAALQGKPRITNDVDAIVLGGNREIETLLSTAPLHGFSPRIPDAAEFARKNRILLLVHEPDGIELDLSLGTFPFEEEIVARAGKWRVQDIEVLLATPEDLIVLKTLAFRAIDVRDIESLLDANPNIDLRRVRRWVRSMAEGLEMPEITERLDEILRKRS